MIQRKQSLYLLIVALLMSVLCFVPLAKILLMGQEIAVTSLGIKYTVMGRSHCESNIYMIILLSISIILPLVTIFLYKKRWLQVRLCMMEMVFLLGMQIYIILYIYKSYQTVKDSMLDRMVLSVVDIIPIAAIIFTYLALRGVAKDIALLKSVDRIR